VLILANSARAQKTVCLKDVPAPAPKTIQASLAGATLDEIEQNDEDGQVSYTANITRHGQERDFTVAPDGKLLSEGGTQTRGWALRNRRTQGWPAIQLQRRAKGGIFGDG
jgi:hypothetical protein